MEKDKGSSRAVINGDKADYIEYLYRIRCHYDSLSKKQKLMADYIITHQDELPHSSINLMARKMATNAPSITRFCQALGFKGFSELKFHLAQELLSPFSRNDTITKQDSMAIIKQKIVNQEKEIIDDTITLQDERLIQDTICFISSAKRLDIFAEGGSAASAMAAYCMFMQLAIPCRLYTDALTAITCASQLQPGDLAMAISYSGSSLNCVNFLKMAREKKATTLGITGYVNSPLARISDMALYCSSKVKNDLRDMHIARMSELSIIGLLQVSVYIRTIDNQNENLDNLIKATRLTRLKNRHNIKL